MKRRLTSILCFGLAAVLWLPLLHLFYAVPIRWSGVEGWSARQAPRLAAHLTRLWENPTLHSQDNASMSYVNPEWDFMARTFLVLGLANLSLRRPELQPALLSNMDRVIEDTLRTERGKGFSYFLMPYGKKEAGWIHQPPRSIFVDGEIALMLAARRMIEENPTYKPLLTERVEKMMAQMRKSSVLSAESYPDECWLFCNSVALAAIKMSDHLDGTDHTAFMQRWMDTARRKLTDPSTGLLISAFSVDGNPALCGRRPEGSSIWMAAHMLQIVDPPFAEDQYRRAKRELGRSFLGFGFSREWPGRQTDHMDVDSGLVLPILKASPSASGLAIMAARAFRDDVFFTQLLTSLQFAGFPKKRGSTLSYQTSNTVGEAVIFYGWVAGPLWERINRRSSP
jgi:hypothetical protein